MLSITDCNRQEHHQRVARTLVGIHHSERIRADILPPVAADNIPLDSRHHTPYTAVR